MSKQNLYSDEHISAYIDAELDNEERARLLFDEQQDAELAQRINEARVLKEKIHLAYSDIHDTKSSKNPFNCTAFVSKQKTLVAGLAILVTATALLLSPFTNEAELILARQLIKNTQAVEPANISQTIGVHKQVVINISQYQPQNFDATINHIESLLQQHSADTSFQVEIVANKQGLKALDTRTSIHAEQVSQLATQFDNLEVIACAKSLARLATEGDSIQLMESIMITPSAAQQVAKRMNAGWLYLKI